MSDLVLLGQIFTGISALVLSGMSLALFYKLSRESELAMTKLKLNSEKFQKLLKLFYTNTYLILVIFVLVAVSAILSNPLLYNYLWILAIFYGFILMVIFGEMVRIIW